MRDRFGRETVGSTADEWREEGWSVEVQGDENDPDCVIILPKAEEKKDE
jgi:hypothetical protein